MRHFTLASLLATALTVGLLTATPSMAQGTQPAAKSDSKMAPMAPKASESKMAPAPKAELLDIKTRGTDHRNGVSFDQHDDSALGSWTGHDAIGAYAGVARHVAKSAESNRTRNLAWQSLARTGRPGVRAG